MDVITKPPKKKVSVTWPLRLLYWANVAFLILYLTMLWHPTLAATVMGVIDRVKPPKKLDDASVVIFVTSVAILGIAVAWKARRGRSLIIYLVAILLVTPYLPRIEVAIAKLLRMTLRSLGSYIQIATLAALASLLLFSLLRNRRYRYGRTYVALSAVVLGSAFVIKQLSSAAVETVHIVEYGGLAVVSFYAFWPHMKTATLLPCYLLSWDVAAVTGILDELYQLVLPLRYCGVDDMLNNITSGGIGLMFVWGFIRPDQKP